MDAATFQIWYVDLEVPGEFTDALFLQGSTILSIDPHVFVLSNQYLDSHCSSCAKAASTSPLMRCSGCGTLRYCNNVSFRTLRQGNLFIPNRAVKRQIGACTNPSVVHSRDGPTQHRLLSWVSLMTPFGVWVVFCGK